VGGDKTISRLRELADDPDRLTLYRDGSFEDCTVGELARDALSHIDQAVDAQ